MEQDRKNIWLIPSDMTLMVKPGRPDLTISKALRTYYHTAFWGWEWKPKEDIGYEEPKSSLGTCAFILYPLSTCFYV